MSIIIGSSIPLDKKEFNFLSGISIATVVFVTMLGMFSYLGILFDQAVGARKISLFISHIRLSLMIITAISMLVYYLVKSKMALYKSLYFGCIIWLLYFLTLLESVTGFLMIGVGLVSAGLFYSKVIKNQQLRIVAISLVVMIPVSALIFAGIQYNSFKFKTGIDWDKLDKYSESGERYMHNKKTAIFENGAFVGNYIAMGELQKEWGQKSKLDINDLSSSGSRIRPVLIRYLSSRGLRKDSIGVSKLSDLDIKNIEAGFTNYLFTENGGFRKRWYNIKWQFEAYLNGGNPSGHSLTQRLEYWRNALHVVKKNPFFGVGVGDAHHEILDQYELDNSVLKSRWQLPAHNQYLTIAIQIGLVGLMLVTFCFIQLFKIGIRERAPLFTFLIITVCVSMLFEDTFSVQAGSTYFGFLASFLLLGYKKPV
ncbi:MAG: O-antigen ligase family protein [Flavobacteriales bacterium]|nr:O-antigen ligase family protein [Flavobacteriales bacterium]